MKKKLIVIASFLTIGALCFAGNAFAVKDDRVTSQKILEADGISGQDTNSGSGVKTDHIQDGAVTDTKISDVSMGKVTGLATALAGKADAVHNHDFDYQKKYAQVVVVAKSGGDFTDPVAAMNYITDASATKPYLVKIMPGVYDLGSLSVGMKEYVDIEGSGQTVTVIQSNLYGGVVYGKDNSEIRNLTVFNKGVGSLQGTAIYNSNASTKITDITAIATDGEGTNFGIIARSGSNPDISNTTIKVAATNDTSSALGVWMENSSATMNNVNIETSSTNGYGDIGIQVRGGCSLTANNTVIKTLGTTSGNNMAINTWSYATVALNDVTTESSGGVLNYGIFNTSDDPLTIRNSKISGSDFSLYILGRNITNVAVSQLDGPIDDNGISSTMMCTGVYDANFQDMVCP